MPPKTIRVAGVSAGFKTDGAALTAKRNGRIEAATAGVRAGSDDPWQPLPPSRTQVTLSRSAYEQMRVAANAHVRSFEQVKASAVKPKPKPRPALAGPQAKGAPVAPSRLMKDEVTGELTYEGHPVRMGGGEAQVFTADGWMKVSAFEAAGLNTDDLLAAQAVMSVAPNGPTARRFHAGPS